MDLKGHTLTIDGTNAYDNTKGEGIPQAISVQKGHLLIQDTAGTGKVVFRQGCMGPLLHVGAEGKLTINSGTFVRDLANLATEECAVVEGPMSEGNTYAGNVQLRGGVFRVDNVPSYSSFGILKGDMTIYGGQVQNAQGSVTSILHYYDLPASELIAKDSTTDRTAADLQYHSVEGDIAVTPAKHVLTFHLDQGSHEDVRVEVAPGGTATAPPMPMESPDESGMDHSWRITDAELQNVRASRYIVEERTRHLYTIIADPRTGATRAEMAAMLERFIRDQLQESGT